MMTLAQIEVPVEVELRLVEDHPSARASVN